MSFSDFLKKPTCVGGREWVFKKLVFYDDHNKEKWQGEVLPASIIWLFAVYCNGPCEFKPQNYDQILFRTSDPCDEWSNLDTTRAIIYGDPYNSIIDGCVCRTRCKGFSTTWVALNFFVLRTNYCINNCP